MLDISISELSEEKVEIYFGKAQRSWKHAALERSAVWTTNEALPLEQIILVDGTSADALLRISNELLVLFQKAFVSDGERHVVESVWAVGRE